MEKPMSLRRSELIDQLCNAINLSGLPAFVIRDILKSIDGDLAAIQEQQYQQDLRAWDRFRREEAFKKKEAEKPDDKEAESETDQ